VSSSSIKSSFYILIELSLWLKLYFSLLNSSMEIWPCLSAEKKLFRIWAVLGRVLMIFSVPQEPILSTAPSNRLFSGQWRTARCFYRRYFYLNVKCLILSWGTLAGFYSKPVFCISYYELLWVVYSSYSYYISVTCNSIVFWIVLDYFDPESNSSKIVSFLLIGYSFFREDVRLLGS
jgi:hypothetical protein